MYSPGRPYIVVAPVVTSWAVAGQRMVFFHMFLQARVTLEAFPIVAPRGRSSKFPWRGTTIYDMIYKCGFDFIRDSDSYLFPPFPQLCLPLIPPPRILTRLPIALPRACCCSSGLWKSSILKKMVVIVLWAIYIYICSKLDWLNGRMVDSNWIAIRGNLPN